MNIRDRILLRLNQPQNIFVAFLRFLNVKYTSLYSNQYYNDHPDKYNFYGISRMLSEYNVENMGVRFIDRAKSLKEIDTPFLAHAGNEFVVVIEKTTEHVSYLWHDKMITLTFDKFLEIWSGTAIIAEADENSVEPNFYLNRKRDFFFFIEYFVIALTLFALFFYFYGIKNEIKWVAVMFVNLIGLVAAALLLLKQLKVQGQFIDNICSLLLTHSDCNTILDTKASKLFNLISWSEIGTGYFLTNIFLMMFARELLPTMFILNLLTLPYTLWSVGYQKFVAKQWCALCLIVQCMLWMIFFAGLFYGLFPTILNGGKILFLSAFYLFFILGINISTRFLSDLIKNKNVYYELKSLKYRDDIFLSLLKKELYCDSYRVSSTILFGNTQSGNIITIISNPHCNPCAMMHSRVNVMSDKNQCGIQYVFTSFSTELDESCLYLIALYQQYTIGEFTGILKEWFDYGKLNRHTFYRKYPVDITSETVLNEYDRHKNITDKLNVISTPTIFFNGYRLPDIYKIEDLEYFLNVKL